MSEGEGREAHPMVAVLAGAAAIVVAAVAAPLLLGPVPPMHLVAGGAGLGLLAWIAGFAATIRRASAGWIIGSLVLLVLLGAGAGVAAHMPAAVAAREDLSTAVEMTVGADGTPVFPADAEKRGPISRLMVAQARETMADQRKLGAETAALGVAALNSPYVLADNPGVLRDCGAIDRLGALAAEAKKRREARLLEIGRAIGALDRPAPFKQAMRETLAPGDSSAALGAMLRQQLAMFASTRDLCRLLARRTWINDAAYFGFPNPGDRAQFQAITARRTAAGAELARLQREGRERMAAAQDRVREALARFSLS